MRFRIALMCFLLGGCVQDTGEISKDEVAALGRADSGEADLCEARGWYGDGECDTFCPRADEDCPDTCSGENPQGECTSDEQCGEGQQCEIDGSPSGCSCQNGMWACTPDLSGGSCVDATNTCSGENPQGECTSDEQCGEGQQCEIDGSPSGCSCQNGMWACTPDLSGGSCVDATNTCSGENPQGECTSDEQCGEGQQCEIDGSPSGCSCQNGMWACTPDLSGGSCVDATNTCSGENPQGECTSDEQCGEGQQCEIDGLPSGCSCQNGMWACTPDLSGGSCVDATNTCSGENPQGECTSNDQCGEGEQCEVGGSPSGCSCQDGMWVCTPDLNGGTCVGL